MPEKHRDFEPPASASKVRSACPARPRRERSRRERAEDDAGSTGLSRAELRDRCRYTGSDRRRCALARAKNATLCPHHLRQQQPARDGYAGASRVAAELLGSSKRLDSATAINRVLGRLFDLVARNRIPSRHAAILVYISQLLLQSLPLVRRERQLKDLQDLLARAADPDVSAVTAPVAPATPNYGGSQSALRDSEHARRDASESAPSSPAIETCVVYERAPNSGGTL